MNSNGHLIESYNQNIYIKTLNVLYERLTEIQHFLISINSPTEFRKIEDLTTLYKSIFQADAVSQHIDFKISKILKSVYIIDFENHDKGNSYYHLTLKLKSEAILWLDDIYENVLSRLIKLYKHLFSKIDNYFINLNKEQLRKYSLVLDNVKEETSKFLDFANQRDVTLRREKLNESQLSNLPFGGLFYIAHLDNIKSILELGILSHNIAHNRGIVNVDISNRTVNSRRDRVEDTLNGNVHDFAPLYFNPKNPMLYTLCKNKDRNTLILLRINPHILLAENVYFSDGNAASSSTQFYNSINDFNRLNWSLIKRGSWYNYEFGKDEGKRMMCSEALVREKIPTYYINDIFVYSEATLNKMLSLFPNHYGINLSIKQSLYF